MLGALSQIRLQSLKATCEMITCNRRIATVLEGRGIVTIMGPYSSQFEFRWSIYSGVSKGIEKKSGHRATRALQQRTK